MVMRFPMFVSAALIDTISSAPFAVGVVIITEEVRP
jgi:hypothetical protein